MFCTTCGREVADDARFCDNCGAAIGLPAGEPGYTPGMPYTSEMDHGGHPHIPNYLVWAILATICCCVPSGIVAIVYAAQVNGKVAAGNYAEARRYSDNARTWCWISLALGIVSIILGIGFGFLGALGSGF